MRGSITQLKVYDVVELRAFHVTRDCIGEILRGDARIGHGGDVWRDRDFRMRPDRAGCRQRFRLEHVECSTREMPAVDGSDEIVLHEMTTARSVDDERALRQLREGLLVQDVVRGGRQRQEADEDVALPEKGFELAVARETFDARHGLLRAAPAGYGKIEIAQTLAGHGADFAQPQNADA